MNDRTPPAAASIDARFGDMAACLAHQDQIIADLKSQNTAMESRIYALEQSTSATVRIHALEQKLDAVLVALRSRGSGWGPVIGEAVQT